MTFATKNLDFAHNLSLQAAGTNGQKEDAASRLATHFWLSGIDLWLESRETGPGFEPHSAQQQSLVLSELSDVDADLRYQEALDLRKWTKAGARASLLFCPRKFDRAVVTDNSNSAILRY